MREKLLNYKHIPFTIQLVEVVKIKELLINDILYEKYVENMPEKVQVLDKIFTKANGIFTSPDVSVDVVRRYIIYEIKISIVKLFLLVFEKETLYNEDDTKLIRKDATTEEIEFCEIIDPTFTMVRFTPFSFFYFFDKINEDGFYYTPLYNNNVELIFEKHNDFIQNASLLLSPISSL